jgi:hypothetical protein
VPLSHDHHHALEIALRLRRATADDLDEVTAAFAEYWQARGERHFAEEEKVIGRVEDKLGPGAGDALARLHREHADLRARAAALSTPGGDPQARLGEARELGRRMHDHVRFEERELFALLQDQVAEMGVR